MDNNKGGRVIFMPDIEYRSWVNKNKELLADIIKSGQVSTTWLRNADNKRFLVRYLGECGYSVTIE